MPSGFFRLYIIIKIIRVQNVTKLKTIFETCKILYIVDIRRG
jgi:hypothetical protein